MHTITGSNLITINAEAGESYRIEYESGYRVNILNQTDGVIAVSPKANFAEDSIFSDRLMLTDDAFYYGFDSKLSNSLYITSTGNGLVSVIRTDR